jgi:hypothetical protein
MAGRTRAAHFTNLPDLLPAPLNLRLTFSRPLATLKRC